MRLDKQQLNSLFGTQNLAEKANSDSSVDISSVFMTFFLQNESDKIFNKVQLQFASVFTRVKFDFVCLHFLLSTMVVIYNFLFHYFKKYFVSSPIQMWFSLSAIFERLFQVVVFPWPVFSFL